MADLRSMSIAKRAEALIPTLRSRAFDVDANRRIPDETIKEMLDAGILQMMAPKRFGSSQSSLVDFLDTGINISRGCGSTGWIFGILGCHHWILGHFPLEAQQELYGQNNYALWPLSFSGKGGTAREVEGGFIVNGRWGFCSGIDFSDWIGGGVLIEKENAHDLHDRYNVLIPKSEGKVIDTWFTAGMRGTGSRDFEVKDVFVPSHRILSQAALQAGETPGYEALKSEHPLLSAPFYGILMNAVMCPVLGITRRVIDDFVEYTRTRVGFRGANPATRPAVQMKIAEAETRWQAMYLVIRNLYTEMDELAMSGKEFTTEARLRHRRDAAWAANQCTEIVDDIVSRAGARAQMQSSEFQLAQRDIHTIRTHAVLDVEEIMEIYGRNMLGVDLDFVRY